MPRRIRKRVIPVVSVTNCERNDAIDESAHLTIRATASRQETCSRRGVKYF